MNRMATKMVWALSPALLVLLSACGVDSAKRTATDPVPAATPPAQSRAFAYPQTKRVDHVDTYFGTEISDPYRWLETTDSADVQHWIQAQNALAQPYLEAIPARERIKQRMTQLWNYERYDIPVKRGNHYFYL